MILVISFIFLLSTKPNNKLIKQLILHVNLKLDIAYFHRLPLVYWKTRSVIMTNVNALVYFESVLHIIHCLGGMNIYLTKHVLIPSYKESTNN